ncbi:MAG: excinuclease ABC subunit UvrA, partial [Gemmatimonadota bacterium]
LRVIADGRLLHMDDFAAEQLDITKVGELLVVVDRLTSDDGSRARLAEAVATAFREGDGDCVVVEADGGRGTGDGGGEPLLAVTPAGTAPPARGPAARTPVSRPPSPVLRFTERFECPNDGTRAPAPSPQLFSFNNPRGACATCNGFGAVLEYDESLIVPHVERSLRDGAIDPWTKPRYEAKRRALVDFARKEGIDPDAPWESLDPAQRHVLLHHNGRGYKGIFPFLRDLEEKRYKQYIRVFLRQYQSARECGTCHGSKLQADALNVRVAGLTIAEVSAKPIEQLRGWLDGLALSPFEQKVADHILREARDRVRFLCDVGLTYLTLQRATRTLSGGEAQRISLSNALGSQLVDTLYVLDEPSIGLHARDLGRLLTLLARLRDRGNTVLLVEHDLSAIRMADYMIELGPASGEQGGHVVFAGPVSEAAGSPLTGQYLTGARTIPLPERRRATGPRWLTLTGAREHNLTGVDIRIPLGTLTCVTGVSGSGKSTLVHDVLYRALEYRLTGEHSAKQHLGEKVGAYDTLTGYESLDSVVLIDQDPIGRSPRSNPVTYIKAYDEIRRIFAALPLARQRKYTASTFSFNVAGGRCEKCEGAGYLEVEMVFMADVFVPCDTCAGRRFKPEVLEVTLSGRSIHDVLQLTVDQAIRFFPYEEKLGQALWQLQQVGLGYLRLGQPATTLSGGEAQRVKIARELALSAKAAGKRLYLMDEPTTGLHLEDVRKLADVLDRLVDAGHTVLLIEHNLDVIKLADWVIDVGPEGGAGGGRIVAMGTPEDVMATPGSHTGHFLREVLGPTAPPQRPRSDARRTRVKR